MQPKAVGTQAKCNRVNQDEPGLTALIRHAIQNHKPTPQARRGSLLDGYGYPALAPTATGRKPMSFWITGREPSRATRCM